MRAAEQLFDKFRPHFEHGGKLAWAWPMFEGAETFLLTPGTRTKHGSHVRDPMDMKRLMSFVVFAIVPAMIAGMWSIGHTAFAFEGNTAAQADVVSCFLRGAWHMLPIIVVSYAVGGVWELLFCVVRKHEINEGFLVTGFLFPLTLPPTTPLWMVAVGISFGVVIGKEVFGGTGFNVLNPALTARAFCFFAFPAAMSGAGQVWTVAGLWNPLTEHGAVIDGFTGATPLLIAGQAGAEGPVAALTEAGFGFQEMFLGVIPGSMGEVSGAAILLGALLLIVTGIGSWRTMIGCVVGLLGMSAIFNAIGSPTNPMFAVPPHYHLVMGGFLFGAVYMATDPVSSAITNTGRWIYGISIGALIVLIRTVNPAYPEGVMLSILFMNVFAPLIDYFVVQQTAKRRAARLAPAA